MTTPTTKTKKPIDVEYLIRRHQAGFQLNDRAYRAMYYPPRRLQRLIECFPMVPYWVYTRHCNVSLSIFYRWIKGLSVPSWKHISLLIRFELQLEDRPQRRELHDMAYPPVPYQTIEEIYREHPEWFSAD